MRPYAAQRKNCSTRLMCSLSWAASSARASAAPSIPAPAGVVSASCASPPPHCPARRCGARVRKAMPCPRIAPSSALTSSSAELTPCPRSGGKACAASPNSAKAVPPTKPDSCRTYCGAGKRPGGVDIKLLACRGVKEGGRLVPECCSTGIGRVQPASSRLPLRALTPKQAIPRPLASCLVTRDSMSSICGKHSARYASSSSAVVIRQTRCVDGWITLAACILPPVCMNFSPPFNS
mmetsp:Transcript_15499/g.50610  ORF Transcript_15499/g.50610 Transcript_15499/m.50610 type:complete len:236 (-) Transcript_15499:113-820(-)